MVLHMQHKPLGLRAENEGFSADFWSTCHMVYGENKWHGVENNYQKKKSFLMAYALFYRLICSLKKCMEYGIDDDDCDDDSGGGGDR